MKGGESYLELRPLGFWESASVHVAPMSELTHGMPLFTSSNRKLQVGSLGDLGLL